MTISRFSVLLLLCSQPAIADLTIINGNIGDLWTVQTSIGPDTGVGAEYRINPDGSVTWGGDTLSEIGPWAADGGVNLNLPAGSTVNSAVLTFSDASQVQGYAVGGITTLGADFGALDLTCFESELESFPSSNSIALQFSAPCPAKDLGFFVNFGGAASLYYKMGPVLDSVPGNYIQFGELFVGVDYSLAVDYNTAAENALPEPALFWLTGLGFAVSAAARIRRRPRINQRRW